MLDRGAHRHTSPRRVLALAPLHGTCMEMERGQGPAFSAAPSSGRNDQFRWRHGPAHRHDLELRKVPGDGPNGWHSQRRRKPGLSGRTRHRSGTATGTARRQNRHSTWHSQRRRKPGLSGRTRTGAAQQPAQQGGKTGTARGTANAAENQASRGEPGTATGTARRQNRHSNRHKQEKETSKEIEADSAFEEFFTAYPKRTPHPNPKKPAKAKFLAAEKKGVDPAEIIRGAENFAAYVDHEGIEPRFVPHAATWLHKECWADHQGKPKPKLEVVL